MRSTAEYTEVERMNRSFNEVGRADLPYALEVR
jgi:hypothetical protein